MCGEAFVQLRPPQCRRQAVALVIACPPGPHAVVQTLKTVSTGATAQRLGRLDSL